LAKYKLHMKLGMMSKAEATRRAKADRAADLAANVSTHERQAHSRRTSREVVRDKIARD
jgi:hypothetical protein